MGNLGWAPTVQLQVLVRALPAPGWCLVEARSSEIAGGWVDEDYRIWDSTGRLVAQSRQLARASLVASQIIGLVMARYVLKLEPLASASRESLVAAIGPTVQRYLTGGPGRAVPQPQHHADDRGPEFLRRRGQHDGQQLVGIRRGLDGATIRGIATAASTASRVSGLPGRRPVGRFGTALSWSSSAGSPPRARGRGGRRPRRRRCRSTSCWWPLPTARPPAGPRRRR